ncbi:alpha/beta fold hydrolase [Streptomyces sp. SAJ15]|uniref:alpha/beta fold hydrolase n=1 Tax=Streptomyces sp. SAJ15 TaxID=2011095 RepID=UPI001185BEBB|nr:alpha/beta hydrolase [Streptomyces sp. SAJ15]TVL92896.1 hypothetical protein CD790_07055 [Streptomyces sp. SAJ15]
MPPHPRRPSALSVDFTERTVHHGPVGLAVRDFGGAGAPLLLLHGAGRTLADWSAVAPELAGRHRVVAMDLRAHGHSDAGPWTIPAVLGDIAAVLEACDMPDAALVGHSLGGMLAAAYADAHPETPAVVNLDGHNEGVPELYAGLDRETALRGMARVREVTAAAVGRVLPAEVFETVLEEQMAVGERLGIPAALMQEGAARAVAETPDGRRYLRPEREAGLEMLDRMHRLDLPLLYRRLSCPLLVLRAGRLLHQGGELAWFDELMAAYVRGLDDALSELAAEHPHITVETLDGAGHAMLLERPYEVSLRIAAYIGRLSLRS